MGSNLLPAKSGPFTLLTAFGLAVGLACGPANAEQRTAPDSEACRSATAKLAVLGPDDAGQRNAFGVRLVSAHAESIEQVRKMQGTLANPSAPAPPTGIAAVQSLLAPGGGPSSAMQAMQRGDLAPARVQWTEALDKARREGRVLAEATALNDLGVLDAIQGRSADARERFLEAHRLFSGLSGRANSAVSATASEADRQVSGLSVLGSIQKLGERMAKLQSATRDVQFQGADAIQARIGERVALLNRANLSAWLGQRAEAEPLFRQALTDKSVAGDGDDAPTWLRAQALGDLAVFYRKAGRPADAEKYAREARQAAQDHEPMAFPMWLLADAAKATDAAKAADARGTADPCSTEAIVREQPSSFAEAGYRWFSAEAQRLEAAGDIAAAMQVLGRAAFLARTIDSPERERAAWAALQRLALARGEVAAAALYGKLAVNAAQRLRGGVETMSRQARQAFLADRRAPYVTLATLLLDRNRLAEAEAVLRLLKEDEGQQFVTVANPPARGSLPPTRAEADWVRRFDALVSQTRTLYAERQRVLEASWGGSGLAAGRAQQERMIVDLTLDAAGQMVASLDSSHRDDAQMQQARALLAKPRATRTPQEQDQDYLAQALATRLLARADDMAAGLRALPRDAERYRVPLTAAQAQRVAELDRRMVQVKSMLDREFRAFAAEPPPKALSPNARAAVDLVDGILGGQTDLMRQRWALDRQIEAREAESMVLRERLAAELSDATAIDFDAAAAASLAQGQRTLAELPSGTVAVYYMQGEKRLDALVVAADQRRAVRLTGDLAGLDARIGRYRKGVEGRSFDVLADARGLYDMLWRPLEAPLREARAGTVMLSLDGAMRALPFAALHDGEHWLIERHALDVYTSASHVALTARPARHWRVAAFGASVGGQIDGKTFDALAGVRGELAAIVQTPVAGQVRGAMPGVALLDKSFTAAALRAALREPPPQRASVVHLASHFHFEAGDAGRSALLLGDGSGLSLAQIVGADYRFDKIDLVTLSACSTALSADDAFGQQIEGLGTLLQAQGAAAVLATLWSVNDGSTAAFMATMYALREQEGLSRAEAIRRAQIELIRGRIAPDSTVLLNGRRSGALDEDGTDGGPWTHPKYWAPFVLMGNWL